MVRLLGDAANETLPAAGFRPLVTRHQQALPTRLDPPWLCRDSRPIRIAGSVAGLIQSAPRSCVAPRQTRKVHSPGGVSCQCAPWCIPSGIVVDPRNHSIRPKVNDLLLDVILTDRHDTEAGWRSSHPRRQRSGPHLDELPPHCPDRMRKRVVYVPGEDRIYI